MYVVDRNGELRIVVTAPTGPCPEEVKALWVEALARHGVELGSK
jgi:hypothetical protein